jgi:hypothetical protein
MPYPDSTYEQQWRESRDNAPFILVPVHSGHTPGPWTASEGCPSDVWHVDMPGRSHSVSVSRSESDADMAVDEVRANARLIAAAPDLLSVAKMAFDYANDTMGRFIDHWDGEDAESYDALCDACEAAIAKAEGRE